jgi:hypothetical protein
MYITGSVRSSANHGKHIHEAWRGANHARLPAQTTTSLFWSKSESTASSDFTLSFFKSHGVLLLFR